MNSTDDNPSDAISAAIEARAHVLETRRLSSHEMTHTTELTITISQKRQTGLAHMLYSKPDGSSKLYIFDNRLFTFDGWLPPCLLQHLPSTLTLPKRFVIKLKPFDDADARYLIKEEKNAYKHMQCQQGLRIPRVFPDVRVSGFEQAAFAMELLQGENLWHLSNPYSPSRPKLDVEYICREIHSCFDAISGLGIEHWDVENLANIMLVQRKSQQGIALLEAACFLGLAFAWQDPSVIRFLVGLWILVLSYSWMLHIGPPRLVLIDWEEHKIEPNKTICEEGNNKAAEELSDLFRKRYLTPFQKTPIWTTSATSDAW